MPQRLLFNLGLRLALAFVLVAAIVVYCRGPILRAVLPFFYQEVNWFAGDFDVRGIGLGRMGSGDHYIYLDAVLSKPVVSHGKVLYPGDIAATGGTLSGYILQMIILYCGVVLGWPAARWYSYPLRAALGFPTLALLLAIDVPFVMVATLWREVLKELDGEQFSALIVWDRFLSYGGRLALALSIGALTVLAVERISQRFARQPATIPTA